MFTVIQVATNWKKVLCIFNEVIKSQLFFTDLVGVVVFAIHTKRKHDF